MHIVQLPFCKRGHGASAMPQRGHGVPCARQYSSIKQVRTKHRLRAPRNSRVTSLSCHAFLSELVWCTRAVYIALPRVIDGGRVDFPSFRLSYIVQVTSLNVTLPLLNNCDRCWLRIWHSPRVNSGGRVNFHSSWLLYSVPVISSVMWPPSPRTGLGLIFNHKEHILAQGRGRRTNSSYILWRRQSPTG